MFHYHFKCEGFYAYATNLTFLTHLIGRLDLIRFSLKNSSLSACLYYPRLCHHKLPNPVLTSFKARNGSRTRISSLED